MMKILIHTPDFPPCDGGISAVAYEYAQAFHRRGHEVLVVTPYPYSDGGGWDSHQPFEIQRILNIKAFALKYYYQWFYLKRILSRRRFDLLSSLRWNVSGLVCEKARRHFSIPHFQWFHGNEIYDRHLSKVRWNKLYEKAVLHADLNVAISKFTKRKLFESIKHGRSGIRSQVVYLGVDVNRFVPAVDQEALKRHFGFSDRYVLLTLGRLVARKGQDQAIRALPEVIRKIPNVLYVIGGKGKYEQELRTLVASIGIEKYVHFSGYIPETEKVSYYQMCDQYLMLSREIEDQGDLEGFGLTFWEANACGKPVIAGNSGGCVEAVQDGVNGLVVDPIDSKRISEGIIKLYDPWYHAALSRSALTYVNNHCSWDTSAGKIFEHFLMMSGKEDH